MQTFNLEYMFSKIFKALYLSKSQKIVITFKSVLSDSRNDKDSIMLFDYVSFKLFSYEQNH